MDALDKDIPIKWSATEIQTWVRATLRLANEAAENALPEANIKADMLSSKRYALDVRADLIQDCWQSAKMHIPEHLHRDLKQILYEEPS